MAERYKIYEQLGAGGVGTVFRAYDSQLKRWVAIKRLLTSSEARDSGADIQEELRAEADSLATLRHPNIVTIFDVASDDEGLFIVMELLQGEDLADIVARGPLPYDDFKELAYQTLEALVAAHQHHILHRDIKPENIKAERLPGGRLQAKIIDFGLARVGLKARKQTEDVSGTVMGSIHYMAPEQLTREPVDERTDLYSLGCVFYEALSGQKAFDGPTMSEVIDKHIHHQVAPLHAIAPHVPPWLGAWVERLMAPRPDDRPANAQQAMEDFRAWERMPSMVPYMPWMAMPMAPDPNYYAPIPTAAPVEDEPVAVTVIPDEAPPLPARPITAPARPQAQGTRSGPLTSSSGASTGRLSHATTRSASSPLRGEPEKKSRLPLIIGLAVAAVAVAGGAFFWMRGENSSSPGTASDASASTGVAATKIPTFELPIGRLMPPLDEDRCLHLIADVGTFQSGSSSDGKPFPAYANDAVFNWRDVAPRGGDNPLFAWQNKVSYAPKRIGWPPQGTGPSVKGNRAALQFKSAPTAPLALQGTLPADTAPFGSAPTKGPLGATIAVVFERGDAAGTSTVVELAGSGQAALTLQVTPSGSLIAQATGPSGEAKVETKDISAAHPTIAVLSWEAASGKIRLFATNPPPAPKEKVPSFQGLSASAATAPDAPLTRLRIGSGETVPALQFHGLLGELLIYAAALTDEQQRLLGASQLRGYYFK